MTDTIDTTTTPAVPSTTIEALGQRPAVTRSGRLGKAARDSAATLAAMLDDDEVALVSAAGQRWIYTQMRLVSADRFQLTAPKELPDGKYRLTASRGLERDDAALVPWPGEWEDGTNPLENVIAAWEERTWKPVTPTGWAVNTAEGGDPTRPAWLWQTADDGAPVLLSDHTVRVWIDGLNDDRHHVAVEVDAPKMARFWRCSSHGRALLGYAGLVNPDRMRPLPQL